MTSYTDFDPINTFESFLKTKLLIDEGHPEMSEPVEILYRQVYDNADSIQFITYKFQQINKLINSILVENQNDPPSKVDLDQLVQQLMCPQIQECLHTFLDRN